MSAEGLSPCASEMKLRAKAPGPKLLSSLAVASVGAVEVIRGGVADAKTQLLNEKGWEFS